MTAFLVDEARARTPTQRALAGTERGTIPADVAGHGEQGQDEQHQHERTGEAAVDRVHVGLLHVRNTNSGRLSWAPLVGLAFMRS